MIQRRQNLRFTIETGESVGVLRERVRQDLDSDLTAKLSVLGSVHHAHAAPAQHRQDLVVPHLSTGG